jgi:hypothetical protein
VNTWLIDKSAIGRLDLAADAAEWPGGIERGLVRARRHGKRRNVVQASFVAGDERSP